jgi:O-succinylbenzoic acid--CoA ligase
LPIYHVSGLSILMRQVILGISVVIEEFEGNKIAHLIDSQHITIVSLVSVMLKRILSAQANLSSLRCILLGGGSASQELFAEAKKRHLPLYFSYGMTETASQFATISSNEIERKFGSVGKPLFPNQLKIISQSKVCDRGEVGEILIKGPTLMVGYYFKNGEVTSFEDGWFNTGDLGYLDEEGFLYIVSRRFDLIISGGENVYPAEIEDVILNHAAVSDCGVIGIEDDEWGQAPVACIVTVIADEQKNNLRQELFQLCQNKLARFKQPKHIFFFEQLPRNTALKLLYHQLQEQVRTMIDA